MSEQMESVKLFFKWKAKCKQVAELEAERDRYRNTIMSVSKQMVCRCDEAYTRRHIHASDCTAHVAEELIDALRGEE